MTREGLAKCVVNHGDICWLKHWNAFLLWRHTTQKSRHVGDFWYLITQKNLCSTAPKKHQLVFFQTSACCGIWGCCSPGKLHPHASKNPMNSMDLMIWLRIFQLNKVYQTSHKNPQPTFSLSSLTIPPWRTCFQLFMFGPKAFELEVNWGGEEISGSGSLPNSTFEETSCCLMVRSVYVYEIYFNCSYGSFCSSWLWPY